MTIPASNTHIRRYLYVAVAVLAALSIALFWLNDQQMQALQKAQNRLYNAQVEIRVLEAEKMFGAPFIAPFPTVDRHGQSAALPNFGEERLLLLFFESSHHPMHLDLMSNFGPMIGDNVKVIGILQAESAEEISPIVEKNRYSFPVYLAVDSPFDLPRTPYSVVIDRTGNVLRLSPIDYPGTNLAEAGISEISQFLSVVPSGDDGQPDLAGLPDPIAQPDPAGQTTTEAQPAGRPDQTAQPPSAAHPDSAAQLTPAGQPDPVADEKAGIYTPTAVDTRAEAIYNPPIPSNNVDLRDFEGVVVIQLVVGTTGNVDTAFVERSSGLVSVDALLLDVARKMVWTPAVHEGERVKMRMSLPFMFRKRPATPAEETVKEE